MRAAGVLVALVLFARCTLVTCDDICDKPIDSGTAGGAGGGAAGGMGGGVATGGGAEVDAGMDAGELDAGMDAGMEPDAGEPDSGMPPRPKVVFVTSNRVSGNFFTSAGMTGAAGADTLCNNAASAAQLPGNFKALISGFTGTPASRLVDASPWVLNGTSTVVFATKSALNGLPAVALNRDENGGTVAFNAAVWTGTSNVNFNGANCSSWSSTSGVAIVGSATSTIQWLSTGVDAGCSTTARIYCFEQP